MIFSKQIEKLYRSQLYKRYDDTGEVFYFSPSDFPGLNAEPYSFTASAGHTLKGYFYSYDEPNPHRIIVFDHGMGAGHRAYMKEIELIARHGYKVFSYDHTGCFESGGEHTNGFLQSLCDLNDCINALKTYQKTKNSDFSVVGHSWGAFSTLNITAFHPDISHIVAMCGFISVERILKSNFNGILSLYRKHLYEVEKKTNPDFINANAIDTLSSSNAKILLIYSDNDPIVKREHHYEPLRSALSHKPNVRFMLVEGKEHNPNYTSSAIKIKNDFFKALTQKLKRNELADDNAKKEFVSSFDFDAMTEQDNTVWIEIFKTLDR